MDQYIKPIQNMLRNYKNSISKIRDQHHKIEKALQENKEDKENIRGKSNKR